MNLDLQAICRYWQIGEGSGKMPDLRVIKYQRALISSLERNSNETGSHLYFEI